MGIAATSAALLSLLLLLLLPFAFAGKCNKDDERALLSIKSAFNNAYQFASWTNTSACCHWYGVKCDPGVAPGRVTGLFVLADSNVSGTIPPYVGDLPFLTKLKFHKLPLLVGNIPSSITRLTRLFVLNLSWNSLSGPIPSFLSQIPSLTDINLSFNQFSGSIPRELANFPINLMLLDVSHNQLCGEIPAGPITASAYNHGSFIIFNWCTII